MAIIIGWQDYRGVGQTAAGTFGRRRAGGELRRWHGGRGGSISQHHGRRHLCRHGNQRHVDGHMGDRGQPDLVRTV